jgi:hypothetical protein
MKKVLFIVVVAAVAGLFSCEQTYYAVRIENKSSQRVWFSYSGSDYELAAGAGETYPVAAYTQPPVVLGVVPDDVCKVEMKTGNDYYEFTDAQAIPLHVANWLPVEVTLTAGKYIDDNGALDLTIFAGDVKIPTQSEPINIYTKKPVFSVTANGEPYPCNVTFTIRNDEMHVTISAGG